MNTLSTPPVADLLNTLFEEAKAADGLNIEDTPGEAMSNDELIREVLTEEQRDYRGLYHRYAENFFCVTPEFGRFLYVCARACRARVIVEYGTSFGVSTIHLASALRDAGGGRIITTELEPTKAERAREHLAAAGLDDLVEIRVGDALQTLSGGFDEPVDLVLLDGAFSLYLPVLRLVEPALRPGSLVLGENAIESVTGFLEYVRDPANGYLGLTLPFDEARGNHLSVRTGEATTQRNEG